MPIDSSHPGRADPRLHLRLTRPRATSGQLEAKDAEFCKRTVQDVALLVPYSIICIVPLSPPGHIFAFSLLNRCFPGAVPSGFTERRQDMYEIYSRIAAQARQKIRRQPDPVRWLKRASRAARMYIEGAQSSNATAAARDASPVGVVQRAARRVWSFRLKDEPAAEAS